MSTIQVINSKGMIENVYCESEDIDRVCEDLWHGGFTILMVSNRVL